MVLNQQQQQQQQLNPPQQQRNVQSGRKLVGYFVPCKRMLRLRTRKRRRQQQKNLGIRFDVRSSILPFPITYLSHEVV